MSYGHQEAGQAGAVPAPLDGVRHFVLPAAVAGGASLVSARLRPRARRVAGKRFRGSSGRSVAVSTGEYRLTTSRDAELVRSNSAQAMEDPA